MDIDSLIKQAAAKKKIPYEFLKRQVNTESRGNPKALGDSGKSRGLMQIHRDTATSVLKMKDKDLDKLYDPAFNLDKGTDYLNYVISDLGPYLPKSYNDYWASVFMAYNSGPQYTKRSLQNLKAKGISNPSYQQIINEMIQPNFGTRPKLDITVPYVKKIIPAIKASIPFQIGTMTLIITGFLGWFLWRKWKDLKNAKVA
jgi:hypothetical protein